MRPVVADTEGILFHQGLAAEDTVVLAKACKPGIEGIVSKRAGSFYKSGRSRNWLKTRNPNFVRTTSGDRQGAGRNRVA
jgi:ATP-dependent DNA ligase